VLLAEHISSYIAISTAPEILAVHPQCYIAGTVFVIKCYCGHDNQLYFGCHRVGKRE